MAKNKTNEPIFTRSEVAQILNVSSLTIANREKHRGSHPATYPVALIEQCIKFSSLESGVLVDPFMGSGTSAVAAVKCGLDYIGFDIDKDYKQFAEDRIADVSNDEYSDLEETGFFEVSD